MREDLVHFIWKFQKFNTLGLRTTLNQSLQILDFGSHNKHSGPDFFSAQIELDGQHWAGAVEIHIRSSDWYRHGHDKDPSYNGVVLHVVWEDDHQVLGNNGLPLPTLVIREYVKDRLLDRYRELMSDKKRRFVNCADLIPEFPVFLVLPWLEHLYRERLEQKTSEVAGLVQANNGDWEKTLFQLLLKRFGQRVNANSFYSLALAIDFKMFRRIRNNRHQLEALLFGLCGWLHKDLVTDAYHDSLARHYEFLVRKYRIEEAPISTPEFMGVRPSNFPTIRLSQFAHLYFRYSNLFQEIVQWKDLRSTHELLAVEASEYWRSHYVFGKLSGKYPKRLSKAFKNTIIINAILPLRYLYAREHGQELYSEIRHMMSQISVEQNNVVKRYATLGMPVHHALDSQALIHLYDHYCSKHRCLECALGNQILN